jgi:hypothetical protein
MVVVFVLVSERTGVGVVKPESLCGMNKRRARIIGPGGERRAPTGFIRLQVSSRLVSNEERERGAGESARGTPCQTGEGSSNSEPALGQQQGGRAGTARLVREGRKGLR